MERYLDVIYPTYTDNWSLVQVLNIDGQEQTELIYEGTEWECRNYMIDYSSASDHSHYMLKDYKGQLHPV
jgi:hypothetical protein